MRSRKTPGNLLPFVLNLKWTSAELAVKTHGFCKIYFVPGEEKLVQYEAILEEVVLEPSPDSSKTKELLANCLESTHEEGLWEKEDGEVGVQTLYVISHCRKLTSPFMQTELIKLSDDRPIDENFIRSYALVYEWSKSK